MNKRASSCLGIFLFPAFLAAAAAQESAPRAAAGQFGPGPFSGLPWFSGQWMNGDQDRLKEFEQYRGFPSDSATQSMPGTNAWHEVAGCASAEAADAEFRQAPGEFVPSFKGVFAEASWKSHIWGDYPATEARKKLIHLGWMDTIPREVGNGNNKNGRLWFDVKNGAADKYFFLLGRKFAYLDERHGDTA